MALPPLPLPALTGRGRRARWRRWALRRLLAGVLAATALVLVVQEVRPPAHPLVTVVVADRRVAAGSVLVPDDVRLQRVAVAQPGALEAVPEAVGRRLV